MSAVRKFYFLWNEQAHPLEDLLYMMIVLNINTFITFSTANAAKAVLYIM